MKAFVMEGVNRGGVREVPEPEVGDYDALVEMVVCGVCSSTDRMLRNGTFGGRDLQYPSILGHESVGRVSKLGRKVRYLEIGSLVTRPSAYSPYRSPLGLLWGGMSERGVVTDWRALREDQPGTDLKPSFRQVYFPEVSDPNTVALSISLSETYSIACSENLLGKLVVVIGTGVAGLSLVRHARLLGAKHVVAIGRRAERLEVAARLGADKTADRGSARDVVFGLHDSPGGADIVFEASGDPAMVAEGRSLLRPGGTVVVYSASPTPSEIRFLGGPRGAAIRVGAPDEAAVLTEVHALSAAGILPVDTFVTHRFPFENAENAFAEIDSHRDVIKAMLQFS